MNREERGSRWGRIFGINAKLLILPFAFMHLTGAVSGSLLAQSPDSIRVVAVVASFHDALRSGDSATALRLLHSDAIILESGDAETRAEYRSHHLPEDIKFARAVQSKESLVKVSITGSAAWVASTSTADGTFDGRQINSAGAELMVLRRTRAGWKITAIHWSSHRRSPISR